MTKWTAWTNSNAQSGRHDHRLLVAMAGFVKSCRRGLAAAPLFQAFPLKGNPISAAGA
jgi:hypothetical protein